MNVRELQQALFDLEDQEVPVLIQSNDGNWYQITGVTKVYDLPEALLMTGEPDYNFDDRQYEAYLKSDEFIKDLERTRERKIESAHEILREYGLE